MKKVSRTDLAALPHLAPWQPPSPPVLTLADKGNPTMKLRQQAETLLRERNARLPENEADLSPEAIQQTLHDLQVHQIELEMENEELRRSHTELDVVRARYFDLFDLAPVGYCTLSERGLILETNLTAVNLLGITRDALIKQRLAQFIFKEDQDNYYRLRKNLFETGMPQTCELRMVKSDDTVFWAHLQATAVPDEGNGPVCRIVISDITERRQIEQQLFVANQRFKALMDALPVGVSFSDDLTCQHIMGNSMLRTQFEMTPEDNISASAPDPTVAGRRVRYFQRGRELRDVELPLQRAVTENRKIPPMELEVRLPSGRIFFAEAIGAPLRDEKDQIIGGLAVIMDMTERKQMENALRDREANLAALFESTDDLIAARDLEGRLILFNQPFAQMIRRLFDIPAHIGLKTTDHLQEPDRQYWEKVLQRIITEDIQHHQEFCYDFGNGDIRTYDLKMNPIKKDHQIIGTVEFTRDITVDKKLQEELRNSREYIQAVLDSVNDAIFVDDANTGQIIDVNRCMCEMYGYSREESLSLNNGQVRAGVEPYTQDKALEWMQKARTEGPQIVEWLAKKRSGVLFWMEVSIRFAVIGGKDRVLASVRDITDRKQAERIIVDSKNELQQVYDSVPVMICQLNPDRKVIEANAYFRSFTGWPDHPISLSEKACGVLGCINSLDDPRGCGFGHDCKICVLRLAIQDTFKTGCKHTDIEYKTILIIDGVKKDIVLLCSTALIQKNNQRVVLLSMVDITERKQTEEALQITLIKYQTLFDAFPLGITISDQAGHIVESNLASAKLLGLPPDQHHQRQIDGLEWKIVRPDGTSMPAEEYASVLALKEQRLIDSMEMGITQPSGAINWISVTAAPLPLREYGVVVTYSDITQRKKTEAALQHSLQEKETLLREVHHRVKNNLAAIISLLELQQDRNNDSQNRSLLAEMGNRIRSMALAHEMLYRSENLSEIDFGAYLQALVEHLRGSFDPHGAIRISVAAVGVQMNLDTAIPCGLIVNELVINALKYAFPADRPRTDTDEIIITTVWDHVTYTLIVADNGVGLPPDLDWTTTRTLGLRLVRMLGQHQLQGTTTLNRAGGTRFTLRFGAA